MRFDPPLARGRLLRRYKRFLADVELADGTVVTMHCPNTGAMTGCADPGSEVWYSTSPNPKRKYPHTLEVVVTPAGRVGVNTGRANTLVQDAVSLISPQASVSRTEVKIPDERGRFDLLLETPCGPLFVEIKNVTLLGEAGLGSFPDAVSERARKHVNALARCVARGAQAALVFCVQHTGIERVTTADAIDPAYGAAVRAAVDAGVQVLAGCCRDQSARRFVSTAACLSSFRRRRSH